MVSYCCVKGCSNNSNHKKKDPKSLISFHAFPCNQDLKTKWLKAIGRPNWAPPTHARICSIHFNQDQVNYEGCRIRIKDDAVPVNSLPVNSNFEASDVEACRVCLETDLKLCSLQDSHLNTCMDSVVGLNENYNIEGLPQFVCYQCAAGLMKCYKLIEKSMISQATLLDIFARHGQITRTLIKQQNREKLNLNSPLACYTIKTNYYYNYDAESGKSHKTAADLIDICFKNENDDDELQSEIKINRQNEININEMRLNENNLNKEMEINEMQLNEKNLNEEINNWNDNNLDSYVDSPVADSVSDNEITETEEKIINCISFKRKKIKREDKSVRKKLRRKSNGLTPDEIDMQKFFDVVKLSLQEQIEEWKRTVGKRSLACDTVHECEVCCKVFAHENSYRLHIAGHDASRGKAECPVCKLRFKTEVLVRSHANRTHARKFFCKICQKVFNNVRFVDHCGRHLQWRRSGRRRVRRPCLVGGFARSLTEAADEASGVAKKHQRWHAGHRYSCASCAFSSAHESALGAHARRAHAHAHACAACGRACVSRRGLALHAATAHRGAKNTTITKAYRCEACDINFMSEGARRVHLLTSSQHRKKSSLCDPTSQPAELRTTCRKCGTLCSSLSELLAHSRAAHPPASRKPWRARDYPTACELCGETVTCRKNHWQHVRRQHPKEVDTYRPVVTAICDTCGKGFQNSTKLHLHQLRHRAPTVRCEACPRLFYDKYALSRHAATHRTNKPYQCRTCGRAFKLRSNLERHSRVHTDLAPYECTMCGKKFKYSSSVNLHIRTVHYKLPHPPRKKRSKSAKDSSGCNDL